MEDPAQEVTINDFKRLEVRVGTVVEVSRVPRTNKLYKVIVDIGAHGRSRRSQAWSTITRLRSYFTNE